MAKLLTAACLVAALMLTAQASPEGAPRSSLAGGPAKGQGIVGARGGGCSATLHVGHCEQASEGARPMFPAPDC